MGLPRIHIQCHSFFTTTAELDFGALLSTVNMHAHFLFWSMQVPPLLTGAIHLHHHFYEKVDIFLPHPTRNKLTIVPGYL